MLGHRGIYLDGWKAVTHHKPGQAFDEDAWELYHLAEDFSETHDLATEQPERLKALVDLWWTEAETHGVLPLDDRPAFALFAASRRPGLPTSRSRFVYYPPVSHIVADTCAPVARGWRALVDLEHPAGGGDGALIARGSINSGFVLYIKEGRLVFDYNSFHDHTLIRAETALTPGPRQVELRVTRREDGGAEIALDVDGANVAAGEIGRLLFLLSSTGMDLGRSLSPVNDDYTAPFAYPGTIRKVVFEIPEWPSRGEIKAVMRAEMTRQ
jgi:arylsulfatase